MKALLAIALLTPLLCFTAGLPGLFLGTMLKTFRISNRLMLIVSGSALALIAGILLGAYSGLRTANHTSDLGTIAALFLLLIIATAGVEFIESTKRRKTLSLTIKILSVIGFLLFIPGFMAILFIIADLRQGPNVTELEPGITCETKDTGIAGNSFFETRVFEKIGALPLRKLIAIDIQAAGRDAAGLNCEQLYAQYKLRR